MVRAAVHRKGLLLRSNRPPRVDQRADPLTGPGFGRIGSCPPAANPAANAAGSWLDGAANPLAANRHRRGGARICPRQDRLLLLLHLRQRRRCLRHTQPLPLTTRCCLFLTTFFAIYLSSDFANDLFINYVHE
uniref:MHD1 domain-containing protein n=1 Tax=Mesocestoides corti TaxID=53468 RepID=A0A5K3FCS1_MESCO